MVDRGERKEAKGGGGGGLTPGLNTTKKSQDPANVETRSFTSFYIL